MLLVSISLVDSECFVLDVVDRRVYRYVRNNNNIFEQNHSFPLHTVNDGSRGLWISNDYIYVSDTDSTAYAYALSNYAYTPTKNITLTAPGGSASPRGITGFDGTLYAMFSNGTLGAYDIATKALIPSESITSGAIVTNFSGNTAGRLGTTDGKVFIITSTNNSNLDLFDIRTGEQATLATTFNAIVLNAPTLSTDPSDAEAIEQITYNLRINGEIL